MEEINPWSSQPLVDVEKLFTDFGIETIENVLPMIPEVPSFMRRRIVIGHRDYQQIAGCISDKRPFHVLTGFMPSGHPHLGHLMVMKEVVWHVQQGGSGYVAIADREAHAVRGISWEKCDEFGKEYLACLCALGFEGTTYFQSRNNRLKDLAFEAATKVNFSELTAIYGFGADTELAHAESVITQVADILFPQVDSGPAPTVVPVGVDQDPHIRLARGIAHKMRMFTIEEREGYISVRSKNAPEAALNAVKSAFPHAKKYEGHVDIKGGTCTEVAARVREIERAHGGFAFYTPSSTYHIFMPGLTGGKMSSSIPESTISFHEPDPVVRKKVMNGITGGRMTLEEQKRLGGEPDRCSLYLLNLFHMVTEDAELAEIRRKCLGGEITCGQCKKDTAERVVAFLKEFREKIDACTDTIRV
ncbi:MAG TPA: tryptophan--tRNA ligase [Methanoregulaceae archaeon]|jgi:tryptophanyl-tRNA synthetase|nr:tryptophan--tRNA ligase [Burkholderiaceae bacterium]NLH25372.1 tryptophan--tRNA ligase [Methanomicrobiales archaeon]HNJ81157.1 tryptophan--tRNA ligase [Methanoregulaceae archaeon]HPS22588.1 tryptophan--tRNA ligase [Methanoregulaceae archaeon]